MKIEDFTWGIYQMDLFEFIPISVKFRLIIRHLITIYQQQKIHSKIEKDIKSNELLLSRTMAITGEYCLKHNHNNVHYENVIGIMRNYFVRIVMKL